jgi:glycogen debranching enzyme
VVQVVEDRLWTPMGPRSLAPGEKDYAPHYGGAMSERDGAYHQGTVWPWLLGPFITADVRFNGEAARNRIPTLLAPLLNYAESRGTGQIPEIFDGDPPHTARGCFAQAWSVAEILRA